MIFFIFATHNAASEFKRYKNFALIDYLESSEALGIDKGFFNLITNIMDEIDIVNFGKTKLNRLKLYEKNQHKGLFVKKADGSREFLTPLDLADAIMKLKNELKELRGKYRLTVG